MPYDVTIQEKPGYLRLEVSGDRVRGQEVHDALELWGRIKEICAARDAFRVLAVYHLKGNLPIMAAYDLGTSNEKLDLMKKFKVALVDLNPESQAANRFAEMVALNRIPMGNKGRMFLDETEAVEWLLAE